MFWTMRWFVRIRVRFLSVLGMHPGQSSPLCDQKRTNRARPPFLDVRRSPLDSLSYECDENLTDEISEFLFGWRQTPFLSWNIDVLRDVYGFGVISFRRDEPRTPFQSAAGIEQVLMKPAFFLLARG